MAQFDVPEPETHLENTFEVVCQENWDRVEENPVHKLWRTHPQIVPINLQGKSAAEKKEYYQQIKLLLDLEKKHSTYSESTPHT